MDTKSMTVAEKLRHYREACALSQQQVAAVLKVERSTYGKYETAVTEPSLLSLVKLAKIFNVSPTELLPDPDVEVPSFEHVRDLRSGTAIYQLSKEERGLVIGFRVLSPEKKRQALAMLADLSKNDD